MLKIRAERARSRSGRALRYVLFGVLVFGCGGVAGGPSTGGESHFLEYCQSSCAAGLDCISGVCTRGCLVEASSCGDLPGSAQCTADSIEPGAVAVCDVDCRGDAQCAALGADHRCVGGFCRRGQPSAPSEGSCRVLHRNYPSGSTGIPAPTGCGTCSCNDGELECPQDPDLIEDCPAGTPIVLCPESITTDPIDVRGSYMTGDTLTIDVGHGGGCARHDYGLCYEEGLLDTAPETVSLRLLHDAHGDACEAYALPRLHFDLRPVARYARGLDPSELMNAGGLRTPFGLYNFGRLECADRASVGAEQASAAGEAAPVSCVTSRDCQRVSIDTACSASCGAVANASGAEDVALAMARIDAGICREFDADGCGPRIIPPCVPPRPIECVNGTCTEVP